MAKMNDSGVRRLEIGSRLFYPGHGVVSVLCIEERVFGASPQDFYVLSLSPGDKVLLPVDNVAKAGVRELVSATKARELLARVTTAPAAGETKSWKERSLDYAGGLRLGCPDRYTDILQELLHRSRTAKLSAKDTQSLQVARGYFVAEIGAVLDMPAQEVEAALEGDGATAAASPSAS